MSQLTGLRRRIELLQDFSMPIASTGIQVTADGQYIMASGESGLRPSEWEANWSRCRGLQAENQVLRRETAINEV